MIASTHLAVGAASGIFIQKYISVRHDFKLRFAVASLAGVATHLFLDALPHEEYSDKLPWPLLIAEMIAVSLVIFSPDSKWRVNMVIFFGMSGAAFPDLLTRLKNPFFG